LVTIMMEIFPQNRPTLEEIWNLSVSFLTRLGFKKCFIDNDRDEF
jgi:hypothetical protein